MTWLRRLRSRRAELDEAAFALPLLLLVSIALVNLALLGYAALNANNAANYGARMGSVAFSNPAGTAESAARQKLAVAPVGTYSVSVSGGTNPGSLIRVAVSYQVPNFFQALARFFGASMPPVFEGSAESWFRKEGW